MKNKKCTTLSLLSSSPPPSCNQSPYRTLLALCLSLSILQPHFCFLYPSQHLTDSRCRRETTAGRRATAAGVARRAGRRSAGGWRPAQRGADEQWTVVWRGGRRSDRRDAGEQLLAGLWPRGVRRRLLTRGPAPRELHVTWRSSERYRFSFLFWAKLCFALC